MKLQRASSRALEKVGPRGIEYIAPFEHGLKFKNVWSSRSTDLSCLAKLNKNFFGTCTMNK